MVERRDYYVVTSPPLFTAPVRRKRRDKRKTDLPPVVAAGR